MKEKVAQISREKDKDRVVAELKSLKDLTAKINVKMLIELSDGVVKRGTTTDMRKSIVKIFAEAIRTKGKGKEANDLTARFK